MLKNKTTEQTFSFIGSMLLLVVVDKLCVQTWINFIFLPGLINSRTIPECEVKLNCSIL